jgi:hypothetical protein
MTDQITNGYGGVQQKNRQSIDQQGGNQGAKLQESGNKDKNHRKDCRHGRYPGQPFAYEQATRKGFKTTTEPADDPYRMREPAGITNNQIEDYGAKELQFKDVQKHRQFKDRIRNMRLQQRGIRFLLLPEWLQTP